MVYEPNTNSLRLLFPAEDSKNLSIQIKKFYNLLIDKEMNLKNV